MIYCLLNPEERIIKFGFSDYPERRTTYLIRKYRERWNLRFELMGVLEGSRDLERLLHRALKPFRCKNDPVKHREWYQFDQAVIDAFTRFLGNYTKRI
ncbi:MAG: GIY-YIG nuclease family protein [Deltaproteobacteria bacterium]|jgi:hypothetical protein|nr:GIY-YIG nuclease family protein [Deltaproteobacteria bacterium]